MTTAPTTAALPPAPTGPPPAAVLTGRRPGKEILTVTARPVPPSAVVIAARGEVDLCTSPLLRESLLAHLRPPCSGLVIDLTDVGFLGAAGLTVLTTAGDAATAAGIKLCVVAHSRPVLRPLTITGLDRVFDLHPDLPQALRCLGGGPAG
ncbi:anti-anti-sigma factor [Actinokineospora alba]|uniref:Anti-sigma factor antagonist n=1 Tax=Actinokineospora alba TaxID=504798 RepID=A0A1H0FAY9_9PSEU|nr:STAS domain-containing protein [Actinokineospora alba]TDP69410.1 anti-anti-sigma factor [Actinokineospora alba]SDI17336.1 anti-anti-sigma factor [Actinokineospora alba]SDN91833.1 anti-anti-sigma factor [Actinokineospora alba]